MRFDRPRQRFTVDSEPAEADYGIRTSKLTALWKAAEAPPDNGGGES